MISNLYLNDFSLFIFEVIPNILHDLKISKICGVYLLTMWNIKLFVNLLFLSLHKKLSLNIASCFRILTEQKSVLYITFYRNRYLSWSKDIFLPKIVTRATCSLKFITWRLTSWILLYRHQWYTLNVFSGSITFS